MLTPAVAPGVVAASVSGVVLGERAEVDLELPFVICWQTGRFVACWLTDQHHYKIWPLTDRYVHCLAASVIVLPQPLETLRHWVLVRLATSVASALEMVHGAVSTELDREDMDQVAMDQVAMDQVAMEVLEALLGALQVMAMSAVELSEIAMLKVATSVVAILLAKVISVVAILLAVVISAVDQ